jgi:hypothetical protein
VAKGDHILQVLAFDGDLLGLGAGREDEVIIRELAGGGGNLLLLGVDAGDGLEV